MSATGPSADRLDEIGRFWSFWREHRAAIETAIADGTLDTWASRISDVVTAIDPDLDWEFGQGQRAEHYFCLSACGSHERRLITQRWLAHGPGDDKVFEFYAARPRTPVPSDAILEFGGVAFSLVDFRCAARVDTSRERIDTVLWHPQHARVDPHHRSASTFIALDTLLGEDDVERWIGQIDIADARPAGSIEFTQLPRMIDQLRATASGEKFSVLRGKLPDGRPIFATVNRALKRVDHLSFDTHATVDLELMTPTPEGLPTETESERLNDAERSLLDALGHDATFVGRETGGGARTIHLFAAATGPALARIDTWRAQLPWSSSVRAERDPEWSALRKWG